MAIGILVYLLLALKWSHIRLYTIWMHDSLQFVVNVGVSLFIQIYGGRTILHSDICHFFFLSIDFARIFLSYWFLLWSSYYKRWKLYFLFFIWTFSLYGKKNIQPHKFLHACTYNQQGRVPAWPRLG